MDKRSIKRIIKYLEARLEEKGVAVSQVIIFGSQAKKSATSESDLDLMIVSPDFRRKGLFKRIDMVGNAVSQTIYEFDIPIDVLLKTPEEIDPAYLKQIGAVVFAA